MKENTRIVWHEDHIVSWEDVNLDNKLSITGLTRIFLQAAVIHSEHLGYGFSTTSKDSISWVLFKINIEIKQMPVWKEPISINTWPHKTKSITAIREFEVLNSEGTVLCNASSEWSIINLETRRPQRLSSLPGLGELVHERVALNRAVERINPKMEFEELFRLKVRYTDMDLNGHATAGKYFDWLSDAVYELFASNDMAFVQFSYHHECLLGDNISIQTGKEDNSIIRGFNTTRQRVAFLARVEMRQ